MTESKTEQKSQKEIEVNAWKKRGRAEKVELNKLLKLRCESECVHVRSWLARTLKCINISISFVLDWNLRVRIFHRSLIFYYFIITITIIDTQFGNCHILESARTALQICNNHTAERLHTLQLNETAKAHTIRSSYFVIFLFVINHHLYTSRTHTHTHENIRICLIWSNLVYRTRKHRNSKPYRRLDFDCKKIQEKTKSYFQETIFKFSKAIN